MGRQMEKVVYGRPDDAYRIGYLDVMWEAISEGRRSIRNTMSDTVRASIVLADDNYHFNTEINYI